MWSAGCVLYTMLAGHQPFFDESVSELIKQITEANYEFKDSIWKEVSDEGKHLIRSLLTLDPQERLSPDETLAHPWFLDPKSRKTGKTPDTADMKSTYSKHFSQNLGLNIQHISKSVRDATGTHKQGDSQECFGCSIGGSEINSEVLSDTGPVLPMASPNGQSFNRLLKSMVDSTGSIKYICGEVIGSSRMKKLTESGSKLDNGMFSEKIKLDDDLSYGPKRSISMREAGKPIIRFGSQFISSKEVKDMDLIVETQSSTKKSNSQTPVRKSDGITNINLSKKSG
jgi:serine/threonine protein kinase